MTAMNTHVATLHGQVPAAGKPRAAEHDGFTSTQQPGKVPHQDGGPKAFAKDELL